MTFDERLEFLLKSQESLGRNIEELHERMDALAEKVDTLADIVNKHEREMERFRRGLRAGLEAYGENGDEQ